MPDKPDKTFVDPATFSFVQDRMSVIKLPVKHASLYKVCQNYASLPKFASLSDLLSGKCRHIIDISKIRRVSGDK